MNHRKGFTLIELMIAVAIIGILAAVAYPSYIDYITKSRRAEGIAAVMRVANLQEQYYLDNRKFATDLSELGLDEPFATEHGYYSVASAGATAFTITATAKGTQASNDSACATITMSSVGIKGPSAECWK